MVGKVSLLLVMGFSLIFLVFGHNFNSMSNGSVDNFVDYNKSINAYNLARSGANMAADAIFFDHNWTSGYPDVHMNGGTINVSVQILNAGQDIRQITATGTYNGETDTIEVILAPTRFSKYAYYSVDEGSNIWWTANDTVFGPFHTEDNLRVDNHPVFGVEGYSTTIGGHLIYQDNELSDRPELHGSFQTGFSDTLTTNGLQPLRDAAAQDGYEITKSHSTDTVYITFKNDSIQVKKGYFQTITTYKTSEIAPNGVIYAQGMDIRLKGTVEGQYSVVSDGNIYIDDDIVYKNNPLINTNSIDLLGIVSKKNVYITDNDATQNIKIDGAIYCQNGGFGAEKYDTRSVDGDIHILGGITQHTRLAVGTFLTDSHGHTTITHGFNKRYHYDQRLTTLYPPFFPTGGGFSIVSWKE